MSGRLKLLEKLKIFSKIQSSFNFQKMGWVFLLAVIIGLGIILPTDYANAFSVTDWLVNNFFDYIIAPIIWAVSYIFILIAWVFTYLASGILEQTIQPGIYTATLGTWNTPEGFINIGWRAIRDLANMFFILILLLIAFGTILRIEAYKAKRLLPALIIAIFLVNFSKIITLVVIDFSQIFMYELYNNLGTLNGTRENLAKIVSDAAAYYRPDNIGWPELPDAVGTAGACIFSWLLALTYIAMAAFMLIRLTMLCILTILSPAVFLLWALPSTKKYFSSWAEKLINYAMVGPIFVFFIWISSLMAQQLFDPASGVSNLSLNIPNAGNYDMSNLSTAFTNAIPFAVVIFMLLFSLAATRQMGIIGASIIYGATVGAGIAGGFALGRITKGATNRWLAKGGRIPGAERLTKKMKASDKKIVKSIGVGFEKIAKGKQGLVRYTSPEVWRRAWKAHEAQEEAEAYGVPAGRLQDLVNRVGGKKTDYRRLAELNQVSQEMKSLISNNPDELADMLNKAIENGLSAKAEAIARKLASAGNTDTVLKRLGYKNTQEDFQKMMKEKFAPLIGKKNSAILASDIAELEKSKGNYAYWGAVKYKDGKHRYATNQEYINESAKKFGSTEPRTKWRTLDARTFVNETAPNTYELSESGKKIIAQQLTKADLYWVKAAKAKELKKIQQAIKKLSINEMKALGPRINELKKEIDDALG